MPADRPVCAASSPRGFAARVATVLLITSLFVVLILMLWKAAQVLLLFFAGVLFAVILRTLAHAVSRRTRLKLPWSLSLVILVGFSATAAAGYLAAPPVIAQFQSLAENVNASLNSLWQNLPSGGEVAERATQMQETLQSGEIWRRVGGIFSTTFGALGGLLVFIMIGIFLAYDPRLYLAGFQRMIPLDQRHRACEVFAAIGKMLQGWLVGQLIAMVFLFATTWIMLALLGVPLAFILALLTGLINFVPYIGPIIALIPILLVSFIVSPSLALYTALLYLVIQTIEGEILMPLVFQRVIHLPAVISIIGQLILGGIFGVLGFMLATPLTAVLLVLAQKLYVEDVLGDSMEDDVEEIPVLGGPGNGIE